MQILAGKFGDRLVNAEIELEEYGTHEAHCRIELGEVTVVPYTLLAPTE